MERIKKKPPLVYGVKRQLFRELFVVFSVVFGNKKRASRLGGSKVTEHYFSHFCHDGLALIDGYIKLFCQRLKKNTVDQSAADDFAVSCGVYATVDVVYVFVDHFIDVSF